MTRDPNREPMDEDRLRAALHAEAAGVEPGDERSLAVIRRRGRAAIVRRRAVLGGLGLLLLVAGLVVVLPRVGDDDQTVVVDPGPEETTTVPVEPMPTTTATTPSTTPSTTLPPPVADTTPYLWPPPDHEQYTEPTAAARSFVTEYVGFDDPQLGEVREAERGLVEIDVLALGEDGQPFGGQLWSTLHLRQVQGGTWRVTLATSDGVIIEGVEATDTSLTVRGRGNGFEGTLNAYAIAAGGQRLGDPSIITVNCCEALEPFESTIAVPERPGSVLVVSGTGLDIGSDFAAAPADATTRVEVHLVAPGGTVQAVERAVARPAVLNGALRALLEGPTQAEVDEGYTTAIPVLPEVPPALLASASIQDGVATVTMPLAFAQAPNQPGGTLPPGQAALVVEQLTRTVFQFDTITAVEFQLDGSCQDFGRWIGRPGECRFERS